MHCFHNFCLITKACYIMPNHIPQDHLPESSEAEFSEESKASTHSVAKDVACGRAFINCHIHDELRGGLAKAQLRLKIFGMQVQACGLNYLYDLNSEISSCFSKIIRLAKFDAQYLMKPLELLYFQIDQNGNILDIQLNRGLVFRLTPAFIDGVDDHFEFRDEFNSRLNQILGLAAPPQPNDQCQLMEIGNWNARPDEMIEQQQTHQDLEELPLPVYLSELDIASSQLREHIQHLRTKHKPHPCIILTTNREVMNNPEIQQISEKNGVHFVYLPEVLRVKNKKWESTDRWHMELRQFCKIIGVPSPWSYQEDLQNILSQDKILRTTKHYALKISTEHLNNAFDIDDYKNEILFELNQALIKFDPRRANLNTFVDRVANLKCRALRRYLKMRQKVRCSSGLCSDTTLSQSVSDSTSFLTVNESKFDGSSHINLCRPLHTEIEYQLERAIKSLGPECEQLCSMLMEHSVAEVANRIDIHRSTIYRVLNKLRNQLEAQGIRPPG